MIALSADEFGKALQEFAVEHVKTASSQIQGLGRFLFTVSSATLGAIVSIKRLSGGELTGGERGSLIAVAISAVIAIWIALPKMENISTTDSLQAIYNKMIQCNQVTVVMWCIVWGVSVWLFLTGGA